MNTQEQLFGLMVVAEEQQKKVSVLLDELEKQTQTMKKMGSDVPEMLEKASGRALEASMGAAWGKR